MDVTTPEQARISSLCVPLLWTTWLVISSIRPVSRRRLVHVL